MQDHRDIDERRIEGPARSQATTSDIQKGGHEHQQSAQGLDTEMQGVQTQVHREGESGVVDHITGPGEEIQSAQTGIFQAGNLLPIPGGLDVNPQHASASSSEFAPKRLAIAAPEPPISLQCVIDKTEEDDLKSLVASEYFQGPDEVVRLSCQECASRFRIVHPDFRVPESIRRVLQLREDPREQEIDVPVISLKHLVVGRSPSEDDKFVVKRQISQACGDWGIFQVRDHGIPNSLLESALDVAKMFFDLRMADKMVYSMRYSDDESGYGGRRSPHCRLWGDQLLHVLHLDKSLQENNLPTTPRRYGEFILRYAKLVMVLNMQLIDACAQVQAVDMTELETALREEYLKIIAKSYSTSLENMISCLQTEAPSSGAREGTVTEAAAEFVTATALCVNYHPPCPRPDLVLGIDPCCARTAFEIVLQNEVPGIQIFQDGRWQTIKCIPNALVVFVGKALEIVSQDMVNPYKAVQFRVVANRESSRISITSAFGLY